MSAVVHVDKQASRLRQSSYGWRIGQPFVGCAVYADDIAFALPSASCCNITEA